MHSKWLLQEAGWENAKSVQCFHLKYNIYLNLFTFCFTFFGYYKVPYVLFHSFDVLTIILHSKIILFFLLNWVFKQ